MSHGSENFMPKDTPQNERVLEVLLAEAKQINELIATLGMPLNHLTKKYFGSPQEREAIRRKEERMELKKLEEEAKQQQRLTPTRELEVDESDDE